MTHERLDTALRLARAHYELEPGIQSIYLLERTDAEEDLATEPVKLLEVNAQTVPAGVMPIYFGARPEMGIGHPSAVVDVTPDEFERIKGGQLQLPAGWRLSSQAAIVRGGRAA